MKSIQRRRSGAAMIMAIVVIGLVAMSLAADAMTCYLQFQRTRRANDEAQLRQLLLAGTQSALARLQAKSTIDGPVATPADLDDAAIRLGSVQGDANQATVDVQAALGREKMTQEVHFTQSNGAWQVDAAELEI